LVTARIANDLFKNGTTTKKYEITQVLVVSLLPPPITGQEAPWGMPFAGQIRADRDMGVRKADIERNAAI
jgi:hypothetical protein